MATKKTSAAKRAAASPSPLAALIALAGLKKGEKFAGLVQENNAWRIVVLLPLELKPSTWPDARAWAEKQGGELPTRREQSLLYANLKDEFKNEWYWSGEQIAGNSDYAWYQYFGYGGQDGSPKDNALRARAVRRLVIR